MRCKYCARHHDSYIAEVRARQQDQFLERVLDHARKQTAAQVQAELADSQERNQRCIDDVVKSTKETADTLSEKREGLESRFEDHVLDVQSKLQVHTVYQDLAKERLDSIQNCVSQQFTNHTMLDEEFQAHVKNTRSALALGRGVSGDLRRNVIEQRCEQEALTERLNETHAKLEAYCAERNRLRCQDSFDFNDMSDATLRMALEILQEKQSESAEIHAMQICLHEALQEHVEESVANILSVQHQHSEAIEASRCTLSDNNEALIDELHNLAKETQCELEAHEEAQNTTFQASLGKLSSSHEGLAAKLQAYETATGVEFAAYEAELKRRSQEQSLSLDASYEVLQERLQEHSQKMLVEHEEQQLDNKMMRERHVSLEMREMRQFGKHENLESSVRSLRKEIKRAHDRFESEHRAHDEAQASLEMNFKAEQEAFIASDKNFASFKVLTADNFRKHDLHHQRAFSENAAALDKISKHDLSLQRLYAELCIPSSTMPSSWGCSPAPSPAQTPMRSHTPMRSSPSPVPLSSR